MSKKKIEMLEKLMDLMGEEDRDPSDHKYPEKKMKATIMADSKEGLLEGAKKIPDALEKAEEYRKMRMGSKESK